MGSDESSRIQPQQNPVIGSPQGPVLSHPDNEQDAAQDRGEGVISEGGTPGLVRARGSRPRKSSNSLVVEYCEGGKAGTSSSESGKPALTIRVENGHIYIAESKSGKENPASSPAEAVVGVDSLHHVKANAASQAEANTRHPPAGHNRFASCSAPEVRGPRDPSLTPLLRSNTVRPQYDHSGLRQAY